jgi:hypothetical protein
MPRERWFMTAITILMPISPFQGARLRAGEEERVRGSAEAEYSPEATGG